MLKKVITALFCASTILVLTSGTDDVLSSGAPIGSTGAPNEFTCGKAGCHVGDGGQNNINTSAGILSISSPQHLSNYVPGETYDIHVEMLQQNIERFGYSLTVLDEKNNRAGSLIITDEQRTQRIDGVLAYSGREYATYRMSGTQPYEPGKGLWQLKWKAPDVPVGKITFYAAAVAANNDGTDKGDLVYTTSVSAALSPTALNNVPNEKLSLSIYPNPVNDILNVEVIGSKNDSYDFSIYDANGREAGIFLSQKNDDDAFTFSLKNLGLPAGVYWLRVQNQQQRVLKKFYINN